MKEIILKFIEPFPARGKAFLCRFAARRLPLPALIPFRFLWLTLLAASSAPSGYVQYASGASLPPLYPLKAKRYECNLELDN